MSSHYESAFGRPYDPAEKHGALGECLHAKDLANGAPVKVKAAVDNYARAWADAIATYNRDAAP